MEFVQPSQAEKEEALKNPNGWVYVIHSNYAGKADVPPFAIKGAWKVDKNGFIEGEFIPNPNYDVRRLT